VEIVVGARGSELSRKQVEEVLEELLRYNSQVRFKPLWVTTTGDRDLTSSLRLMDKTNFFTKEVDELQLKGGGSDHHPFC